MSDLANYATKNCKFAGISGVRTNKDGTISISIQSKGEHSPLTDRVAARQERMEAEAAKKEPKPFWFCQKPKYPYSSEYESTIGNNSLRTSQFPVAA